MNTLSTTLSCCKGRKPVHLSPLPDLLKLLRVRPRIPVGDGRWGYMLKRAPVEVLWDYLEEARNNHRQLILQHHPDKGGSNETAATINTIWNQVRELFRRKGFELA